MLKLQSARSKSYSFCVGISALQKIERIEVDSTTVVSAKVWRIKGGYESKYEITTGLEKARGFCMDSNIIFALCILLVAFSLDVSCRLL